MSLNGEPRTIALVISSVGAGGAERVMSLLAGEWARRGNRVVLITLGPTGNDHYWLHPDVQRVGLDALKPSSGAVDAVKKNVGRLAKLRSAIKSAHPDVIISFMDTTNVLTLMATASIRVPILVSERIDPRHYPIAGGWAWLRKKLYPTAHCVVVQTESVAEWARKFVPVSKVHVVPNPVVMPVVHADAANNQLEFDGSYIVAMGRLDRQKGFDMLLEAFSQLPEKFSNYDLVILGEGPERGALEQIAADLGLTSRVRMPGRLRDPVSILSEAECFVLSSRFEGFPNALMEAMASGLPVISFECPSGPSDIVTDQVDGLLVEAGNVKELDTAIGRILEDKDLANRLGEAARSEMANYSLEHVTDEWEQLFGTA